MNDHTMRYPPPSSMTILFALLMALAGCRSGRDWATCDRGRPWTEPVECQPVEPRERMVDLSRLPPPPELSRGQESKTWCGLSQQTACVVAARYSLLANMLEDEVPYVRQQFLARHHLVPQAATAAAVVHLLATEQRNRSAGQALELHLRLAEVQEGIRNIARSLQEVEEMGRDLEALLQQGIPTPTSKDNLELERLELTRQHFDLTHQAQQLSDHLVELLGDDANSEKQYWPELSLAVEYYELDHDELIAMALGNRAELQALRLASSQPPESMAPLAPLVLGQVVPGAALVSPSVPVRLDDRRRLQSWETQARQGQLDLLLTSRMEAVQREVVEAARGVENSYPRIAWAARRLELAQGELKWLEQQQATTTGSPFDVRRTRLKINLLRQEVLHEVIQWKLFLVKLQEAQGLLADGGTESGHH